MLLINNYNMMWYSIALFFITLAIVGLFRYVYRWSNPKCNGKLPPGSMGFPLIGETIQFFIPSKTLDVSRFVKKRIARYGPVFRTNLVGRPVVISADPEFNAFIMQQELKLVQLWYMDSFSKIIGNTSDNAAVAGILKYFRNLVLGNLGTESLKEKLLPQLEAMVNQSLRSWSTQSSVELKDSIASMVFDWTAMHLFNYDPSKSSENLSKMFVNFFHGIMSFPLNVPGTTLHECLKNQKTAMKLTREILHKRLTSPEKQRYGDLLDQLIDDMKTEEFLTEDLIFSIIFVLLLASLETISSALTLAMILLTDHPLVVKELMEEHGAILRNREENLDSPLTWKEYKSMTFTSQVINETLRMANPDPGMLRKVIKDIHINGYVIPEGWTIMIVSSAVHMNPDKYKDPLAFNPWRWNDRQSNTPAKIFKPFGGGIRGCVGAEFSRVVMSIFLHALVTKFSWTKVKGGDTARTPALSFGNGFHVKISEKSHIMEANTS